MLVYCTEQHHIKRSKPVYKIIDQLSIQAKKIFNQAVYEERQIYFKTQKFMSYYTLYYYLQTTDTFKLLPCKIACQVLKQVATNFSSFVKASITYANAPEKFEARPKLPKYKDKKTGRFKLTFTKSEFRLKENIIHFHKGKR